VGPSERKGDKALKRERTLTIRKTFQEPPEWRGFRLPGKGKEVLARRP